VEIIAIKFTFLYLKNRILLMAKLLIVIGLLALFAGTILYFFPNAFRWFGSLPGDFHTENENISFHFPFMTCLLLSIFASLIFWLLKK